MAAVWLINGVSPESLGVKVIRRVYQSMNADELTLQLTRADAGPRVAGLAPGDSVVVSRDGTVVFRGTVESDPASASGRAESRTILVLGAWRGLERQVFQKEREYIIGYDAVAEEPIYESVYFGEVVQGLNGESTGARINEVMDYAASIRTDLQAGSMPVGIPWTITKSQDQKCAEVIRGFARLTPNVVQRTDHTTNPPTINFVGSGASRSFSLSSGLVKDYSVDALDSQVSDAVVIRYERPVILGENRYVEREVDAAGGSGDGTEDNAYVRSIALDAKQLQFEYLQVETEDIPQVGDADGVKLAWFVKKNAELAALEEFAVKNGAAAGTLAGFLKLPNADNPAAGLRKYTLTVVGPEEREPLNPDGIVIPPSTDPEDYPRELVGGAIAEWTGRRYRPVQVTATLAVAKDAVDAIGNDALRRGIKDIFKIPRSFGNKDYLTANFSQTVMGTNAKSKTYTRTVSYDYGEPTPVGIAQALLNMYSQTRYRGHIVLKQQEANIDVQPGDQINISGGQSEWGGMNALAQRVDIDDQYGETRIDFGPPEQLDADDLIGRLRAARKNPVQYRFLPNDEENEPKDALGGIVATPYSNGGRENYGDLTPHAWYAEMKEDGGSWKATFTPGYVLDFWEGGEIPVFENEADQTRTVAAGETYYVKIVTDADGKPTSATFESSTDPEIVPHQPDLGDSSQDGEYWQKVVKFEDKGGIPTPKYYLFDSIQWQAQSAENVGQGQKVFKDWNVTPRRLRARSINGTDGTGTVKAQVNVFEEGDEIKIEVLVPDGGSGTGAVPGGS